MICDLLEEGWPSMDLCAEALLDRIRAEHAPRVSATAVRPVLVRRATRLTRRGFNTDRFLNRFWDYPRALRPAIPQHDAFHVVDHSYAHLVHELPVDRTGVFCHDLDAFRCLTGHETRPYWFRRIARRILKGMKKAALVFCSTEWMRGQLAELIDRDRIITVGYGPASEFQPSPGSKREPFLLHVGSCIERKRVDVLLETFGSLRKRHPELRLVQVGGTFAAAHQELVARLGVAEAIVQRRDVGRSELAALYRRAALVLMPSEREGFGIPVIEALACGAPVLASDIPVLREVGGEAITYAPVGAVSAWIEAAERSISAPDSAPPASARIARAARYTWSEHARVIVSAYERLLG